MAEADTHMEELVEHSGSMAAEAEGARLRGPYHGEALLAPEADFIVDDHASAHSGMEVADRLTYLEQRIQMQEDEIQLLKMALADVLKRLNISEEQTAAMSKRGPAKARPVSLALPSKSASNTASSMKKSSSSTLPSTASSRNYSPSPGSKRSPAGSVKDSPSGPSRRTPVPSMTSTCRKPQERIARSNRTGSSWCMVAEALLGAPLDLPLSASLTLALPLWFTQWKHGPSAADPCLRAEASGTRSVDTVGVKWT
ncbi:hypothetical protein NFI96_002818 [Prochilodus magdalenae]|nr:hypothetical protein NFI96_002818 [Prochilodus magdalenae]